MKGPFTEAFQAMFKPVSYTPIHPHTFSARRAKGPY